MSDVNFSDVLPPFRSLTLAASEDCSVYEIGADGKALRRLLVVAGGSSGTVPASVSTRTFRVESLTGKYALSTAAADPVPSLTDIVAGCGYTPMNAAHPTFPAADPLVAGEWWDNAGVLTKSTGAP